MESDRPQGTRKDHDFVGGSRTHWTIFGHVFCLSDSLSVPLQLLLGFVAAAVEHLGDAPPLSYFRINIQHDQTHLNSRPKITAPPFITVWPQCLACFSACVPWQPGSGWLTLYVIHNVRDGQDLLTMLSLRRKR